LLVVDVTVAPLANTSMGPRGRPVVTFKMIVAREETPANIFMKKQLVEILTGVSVPVGRLAVSHMCHMASHLVVTLNVELVLVEICVDLHIALLVVPLPPLLLQQVLLPLRQ